MRKHRGRFALTGAALWMTLGCGGRSDTELYSEIEIISGTGGVRSSAGGATSLLPLGGSKSLGGAAARSGSTTVGSVTTIGYGGWSASGGWSTRSGGAWSGGARASGGAWSGGAWSGGAWSGGAWSGGTLASTAPSSVAAGASSKGACCVAHNGLGCSDAVVESCVCRRDALCCAVGWDPVCVSAVTSRGCGTCATGGTPNVGGAAGTVVGAGGWFSTTGGMLASGGAVALGGNTSVPSGGNTSVPSGGNTSVPSGGGVSNLGGAAPVAQNVIDDLEDGDGELLVSEGRNGYWYTFNDGSAAGVQQPVSNGLITSAQPIDDNGSRFAAWTRGSGFISWGGGLALTLRLSNRPYNASKYQGISFWAKTTRGSTNSVRVNVTDNQTVEDGGICTECWDHFGLTVVLSERWGRYSFSWRDLAQRGWGAPLVDAINPAKLSGIEFSTQEGVEFELYVDNVAFF